MIRSSDRTRVSSSLWLNGLGMKSSAPASIAFVFSWPMLDVTMITGSTAVSSFARSGADRVTVDAGHHHVEEDEVRLSRLDELERRLAVVAVTTS